MKLFGRRTRPEESTRDPDDAAAAELVALAREVGRIGFAAAEPQRERIQEIGRALDQEGGIDRMRIVHALARAKDPSQARYLEREWGGIGMWRG